MTATATTQAAACLGTSTRDSCVGSAMIPTTAEKGELCKPPSSFVRDGVHREIIQGVIRAKLQKRRHLVVKQAVDSAYLDALFPALLEHFHPQTVQYNGGIGQVPTWKLSCYLEVMENGIPTAEPSLPLLRHFSPLLDTCNELFLRWYTQQHPKQKEILSKVRIPGDEKKENSPVNPGVTPAWKCRRLMTFITRYRPNPGENALLKVGLVACERLTRSGLSSNQGCLFSSYFQYCLQHVDGAGKVDGSVVVALPVDRWSSGDHEFEGGGLTFWDGRDSSGDNSIHYDTRSGDVAFIDRYVSV
jgi:hypothetical protein